jgi:HAD superfamily hydrolase (TIGR01549 family)
LVSGLSIGGISQLFYPNGIRAILFDLDGTLRHNRPPSHQVFFAKAVQAGLQDSQEGRFQATRWAHFYWASSTLLREDLEAADGDDDFFWENYVARQLTVYGCSPEEVRAISPSVYNYMAREYTPEDYIPTMVPTTLQSLQEAGFTLGVVSNRRESFQEYLDSVGLLEYVNFTVAAGEVNSWKPDPGIFREALRLAEAAATETIYVGDNYYADILGAQRVGIRPVLLDPDTLFPDAECEVIQRIEEVSGLIGDHQ